jgi:uncharacterized membrane protein YidH (DUF202 family)
MHEARTPPSPPHRRTKRVTHAYRRAVEVFLVLVPLFLLVAATPGNAQAAPVGPQGQPVHASVNCNGNATCDLEATLTNVQYFLIGIAVLIAGVAFAMFGIQHMTGAIEEMPAEKKLSRKK